MELRILPMELRWFGKGVIPKEVANWFLHLPTGFPPYHEPQRTDQYLSLSHCDECDRLGIKIREERLEIKYRQNSFSFIHKNTQLKGVIEDWLKWGWSDSKVNISIAEYFKKNPTKDWISVEKKRQQRWFKVSANQSSIPQTQEQRLNANCAIEVTNIKVMNQVWWTLAFDVFEKWLKAEKILLKLLGEINIGRIANQLNPELSIGYPGWLQKLQA